MKKKSERKKPAAPATMACDPSVTTIDEAKAWLRENTTKGGECPCCRQRVQFYRRPLTTSMVYVLILIDRYCQEHSDWLHVPSHLSKLGVGEASRGGDWAKLVHWGFIVPKPEVVRDDESSRTGFWRITPLGHDFVYGTIRAPRHVRMYNGKVLRTDTVGVPTVSVHEAIGKRFDYDKLMRGVL